MDQTKQQITIFRRTKAQARGKFLFQDENKIFIKAAIADGMVDNLAGLSELGVNVVWLSDPNGEQLNLLDPLGLKVVACLGLENCFQSIFAGSKNAHTQWLTRAKHILPEIENHPALIALARGLARRSWFIVKLRA